MRLRLPELYEEKRVSPYRFSRNSGGRVSLSTAYRLRRENGKLHTYKSDLLDALCDVLNVAPGELWEREPDAPAKPAARKRGKHKRAA